MLLEGLHIPVTTPFHRDGRLNTHKLAANVVRYSRTPAAGLIILGPSGEPTLLNDAETREALSTAAQAAAPEKVLIAGISRDSVHGVLELANFAAEQRYDAVLLGSPSMLAGRSHYRELLIFFQALADRSPLPVVILGQAFLKEALETLVTHPNIIGSIFPSPGGQRLAYHSTAVSSLVQQTASIKRQVTVTHTFAAVTSRMKLAAGSDVPELVSAGSLAGSGTSMAEVGARPALRTRTKSMGFQVISGNSLQMLDALTAGAVGIVPAFAAAAPQACYEVFAAWKDQDQALAAEKQERIIEAARLVESLGPGGLKFAADLNGYFGGPTRLPHLPLTAEQRNAIERLMKPIRN